MYTDNIRHSELLQDLSPEFKKALSYLSNTDFSLMEQGRYEIDGDNMFAVVQEYQTQDASRLLFESHYDYIDIQYIVSGCERIQLCDIKDIGSVMIPYKKDEDIIFYNDPEKNNKSLVLSEGDFAVFKREDCHKTRCNSENENSSFVKKVIVKVRI